MILSLVWHNTRHWPGQEAGCPTKLSRVNTTALTPTNGHSLVMMSPESHVWAQREPLTWLLSCADRRGRLCVSKSSKGDPSPSSCSPHPLSLEYCSHHSVGGETRGKWPEFCVSAASKCAFHALWSGRHGVCLLSRPLLALSLWGGGWGYKWRKSRWFSKTTEPRGLSQGLNTLHLISSLVSFKCPQLLPQST